MSRRTDENPNFAKGNWSFDDPGTVADFQQIARTNIPNYEAVIRKCVQIADRQLSKTAQILDVGSARGRTLEVFYEAGYRNLFGVDSSSAMIKNSFAKASLFHAETLPPDLGGLDLVMANWVLHFVAEREAYIDSIFSALKPGGIFILSEKVAVAPELHDLYHDFKRANGITDAQIKAKAAAIQGVLTTHPFEWYLEALERAGFRKISVIDASFSFITFYCVKPESGR